MAKADRVTKYDAGGSGDNYIDDGYIKTVEKVWLDEYSIDFTNTKTTIDIARIPDNKKITGIEVSIKTSASQSKGVISIGNDADAEAFLGNSTISHNKTITSISLPGVAATGNTALKNGVGKTSGFQDVTSGTTGNITLTLGHAWTMTTGTVKTKVRYT